MQICILHKKPSSDLQSPDKLLKKATFELLMLPNLRIVRVADSCNVGILVTVADMYSMHATNIKKQIFIFMMLLELEMDFQNFFYKSNVRSKTNLHSA